MAALLSYEAYVRLSGDTTSASADAEAAMVDAIALLDDCLQRTLTEGDYTEEVKITPTGHAQPRALPITAIPADAEYQIGNTANLRFVTFSPANQPFFDTLDWQYLDYDRDYPARWPKTTVTYTGGWTEETLPFRLKKAIALLAKAFLTDPIAAVDARVTSKTVGDVSISFSPKESEGAIDSYVPGLWCTIRGFRRHVT